ncbi:MAG TPA: hypothetical protein VHM26_04355 [Chitinophagaceae bacterium]|jgi:hypothetical protein|nr:hypothetical protein [Chitinophagaceae bacterium]
MFEFINSGQLSKVKIKGYENIDHSGPPPKIFEAFINPDEFTVNYSTKIDHTSTTGQTGTSGNFLSADPMELSLKFFLDGTKASGPLKSADGAEVSVAQKITEFYEACGYNPNSHRPSYVEIFWGDLHLMRFNPEVFHGCLKSVAVNYKMFNQNGTPLRAIINATFVEAIPPENRDSAAKASSPDLTHIRIVNEGDTLPGMTQKIYGNFNYYLEVAKANGLTDFRNLQPGMKLFFPPIDKNAKLKAK